MGQCILDKDQAREALYYLHKKRGYSIRRIAQLLGVGKSTIHRVLRGEQEPPGIVRVKLCSILEEDELANILRGNQLLQPYGLVDGEGRLNKPLAIALVDALMQNEHYKEEVLSYLLKYYKEETTTLLSETLPKITLEWTPGFEKWLTEKKSKPVSRRTLEDYRRIWRLCLEGKTLGWHLVRQLSSKRMLCRDGEYHPTGWPRQVFRHYIRYLYAEGKLDWDTYTRLLLAIPGRRYGRRISQKPIDPEEVKRTLRILGEKRPDIYTLYLLILYSGVRYEHVLNALKTWSPGEMVYVGYLARNVRRLECPGEHCRYYLDGERGVKPAAFMFFPQSLLPRIEEYRVVLPGKHRIYKVVRRLGGLPAKYIRTWALRQMLHILGDNDVTRFILGKFGELTVSARHYRDLLTEADTIYPKYANHIQKTY